MTDPAFAPQAYPLWLAAVSAAGSPTHPEPAREVRAWLIVGWQYASGAGSHHPVVAGYGAQQGAGVFTGRHDPVGYVSYAHGFTRGEAIGAAQAQFTADLPEHRRVHEELEAVTSGAV